MRQGSCMVEYHGACEMWIHRNGKTKDVFQVHPFFNSIRESVGDHRHYHHRFMGKIINGEHCGRYEHAWATKLLWDTPSINTNRFRPILAHSRQLLKNVHFCSFCSLHEPGGLFSIINGQKHFPRWPPTPLNRFQSILSTGTLWNVRIKCLQKPYQNRIKNVSCLQFVCKSSDSSTPRRSNFTVDDSSNLRHFPNFLFLSKLPKMNEIC